MIERYQSSNTQPAPKKWFCYLERSPLVCKSSIWWFHLPMKKKRQRVLVCASTNCFRQMEILFKSYLCDGIIEFLPWNVRHKVKMYTRNIPSCLSSPDAFADLESPTVTHGNPDRNNRLGWSWVGGLVWCEDNLIVPLGGGYQDRCVTYLGEEELVWDVYVRSCYTCVQGWHTSSWPNNGASVLCVFRILLRFHTRLTHL